MRSTILAIGVVSAVAGAAAACGTPGTSASAPASFGMGTQLRGVACVSSGWCVAVGSYSPDGSSDHQRSLIEISEGATWLVARVPSPSPDTELRSVSCTSRDWCMAVGSSGSGGPIVQHAFAVHWNGSSWSSIPVAGPSDGSGLSGVTCLSPTSCLSVGSSLDAGLPSALIETWNGAGWSLVSTPTPRGSVDSWLNAVACSGSASCTAVGADSTSGDFDDPVSTTLVERWNGAAWSVVPSPTPGSGNLAALTDVACPSSNLCFAVGSYSRTNNPYQVDEQGLVELWNGADWSVVPDTGPAGAAQDALQGISCPSSNHCVAVGTSSAEGYGSTQGLVASWHAGSWRFSIRGVAGTVLEALACTSPVSCLGVGERTTATSPAARAIAESGLAAT